VEEFADLLRIEPEVEIVHMDGDGTLPRLRQTSDDIDARLERSRPTSVGVAPADDASAKIRAGSLKG